MSAPDLSESIRSALLTASEVTNSLPAYLDSFPIFTRRPVPPDTPYPCLVISQDITLTEKDGVRDDRPLIQRDIAVYHTNEKASHGYLTAAIAQAVKRRFHAQRTSLTISGWDVVQVQALPPIDITFSEGDQLVGHVVQLSVLLAALRDA